MAGYGLDLPGLEYGQVADTCGCSNECLDSTECVKSLD
jgi:hypothetical protein